MKTYLALLLVTLGLTVHAGTPFYYSALNSDGTAQTNPVTFQPWPPAVNGITVYGTNVVLGAYIITNTPNASGFFSNNLIANTYKFSIPALSFSTYAVIPDTTNYTHLGLYLTNSPVITGSVGGFGLVTNYLGYTPPPNTYAGITAALTYVPATNNPGTNVVIYVSAVSGITNASGYITNLTVTLTTNTINYQIR
jgi:hypothetical protein